jgi:hypothetical protein
VTFGAGVRDDIAQDGDILLAIRSHAIALAGSPPFNGLQTVARFGRAERVLGQLVELDAMSELLVQQFVDIEGKLAQAIDGRVGAQNFEIEAIAVERNDAGEVFELGDQGAGVRLEPAAKSMLAVPGDGNGQAESADVAPAALDLMRKAKRFNVEINFAIEEAGRRRIPPLRAGISACPRF